MDLRIDRVLIYPYSVARVTPFRIATMTEYSIDGVFVAVESNGLVGWGEAMPFHAINGETQGTCVESLKVLGSRLVGRDAMPFAGVMRDLRATLPTQTTALGAIDCAILDLVGQSLGVPIYGLFGGENRGLPTDMTISIVDAETAGRKAAEISSAGFGAIKVKLGDGPENDVDRVEAVRDAAPEVRIRVDANQAYDRVTALAILNSIADFEIEFCEQPVRRGDWAGLKWLHDLAPVPVMADESCFGAEDAFGLMSQGCCSLVNVKLCKSGGILAGREVATIVRNSFGRCMVGGMSETRLGVTASAHLGCSDLVFEYFDLDSHVGHAEDVVDGGIEIEGGVVRLGSDPGLGARPRAEFLASLPMIEIES